MSLFSTLNTGASGLGTSGLYLSVVGDNIANINTTGYKASRANFGDMLPQKAFGLGSAGEIGTGSALENMTTLFGQGTLTDSDSATDMAISGNGFFVVSNGQQDYYTRNGTFGVDDGGFLVDASGNRLQGYNSSSGTLVSQIGDLHVSTADRTGTETSTIELDATLSADEGISDDLTPMDFYGTGTGTNTIADASAVADFSTSATIYDSLGVGHEATILFERTSDTTWSWRAVTDASQVYDSTGTPYSTTEGDAFEMASGTITFDTSGAPTAFTQTDTTGYTFLNSTTPSITFDFGLDATGATTNGAVTMNGEESAVTSIAQDGMSTGSLSSISIQDDGTILGSYTNGEEVTLGQVALATFKSTDGLERVGDTLFAATADAGSPAIGVAGTGGRGDIAGNALESSNVSLEDQFVQMISAQRTYQANSKVISTVSDTLANLMQVL